MGLPERWLDYKPMGNRVGNSVFIPFKCPLRKAKLSQVKDNEKFEVGDVLNQFPSLALVIDLRATYKPLYKKKKFERKQVRIAKVIVPGRIPPTLELIKQFVDIVDKFIKENGQSDKLIGVHCTHGVNRTGYMICAYLILRMGYSADEAVAEFSKARGHPIEYPKFISSLRNLKSSWIERPRRTFDNRTSVPTLQNEQLGRTFDNRTYVPAWENEQPSWRTCNNRTSSVPALQNEQLGRTFDNRTYVPALQNEQPWRTFDNHTSISASQNEQPWRTFDNRTSVPISPNEQPRRTFDNRTSVPTSQNATKQVRTMVFTNSNMKEQFRAPKRGRSNFEPY